MKFFNTAGPVNQEEHYKVDPLYRWDLDEIISLISQKKYFILHAPRQTGKTSCMLALQDLLLKEGKYTCLYVNIETAQTARHDVREGIFTVIAAIENSLFQIEHKHKTILEKLPSAKEVMESKNPHEALHSDFLTSGA